MAKAKHDSITRRGLLSGVAATIPAAVMPAAVTAAPAAVLAAALAATPDPIFAAIEAHVCAFAEFNAVLDDLAAAEKVAWHAPRGKRRAANKRLAQARAADRRFGDLASDVMERLVATVPQTLEGAVAVMRYVRKRVERGMCDDEECVTLLASIEACLSPALGGVAP